ncbi:MAG: phosphoglycerate dehydrogenase, partial [Actinomycetota bacterium]
MIKRILVTEEIADIGIDRLRNAGFEVDVQLGASGKKLHAALAGASALIVRSATQVDVAALEAGRDLVVVGRAGVG